MRKYLPYLAIAVAGLSLFVFSTHLNTKAGQGVVATVPPRLQAAGNQLVRTDNGKPLRLKGFVSNFFRRGAPLLATTSDVLHLIDETKELGGNAIDFYYDPWKLYNSQGQPRPQAIALMDAAVAYAGERGIYVLAELSDTSKNVMAGADDNILKAIVEKYKDKTYFIPGIWAEPHVGAAAWEPRMGKMINLVREINPQTPIVVSGANFGRDFGFLVGDKSFDSNVILSVHDYVAADLADYHGQLQFEIDNPALTKLRKTTPIMYGEFGGFWAGDFLSSEDLAIIKAQLQKIRGTIQG